MKPVDQNLFGNDPVNHIYGNCFQACIASILEMPLEAVPHLAGNAEKNGTNWREDTNMFLKQFGLHLISVPPEHLSPRRKDGGPMLLGYYLMAGQTTRGFGLHAVIGKDGEMVHDPHPSRAGILAIEQIDFFVPLDPTFCIPFLARSHAN